MEQQYSQFDSESVHPTTLNNWTQLSSQYTQPACCFIQDNLQTEERTEQVHSSQKNLNQYSEYFRDVQQKAQQYIEMVQQDKNELQLHKIILLKQKLKNSKLISLAKPFVVIVGEQLDGKVIKYEVIISKFKMEVTLLNINEQPPVNLLKIGEGGYGAIFKTNYGQDKNIVIKRINFKKNHPKSNQQNQSFDLKVYSYRREIEKILCEYSVYKICSFLKIGPKIIASLGFDLICYNHFIEFFMEECEHIDYKLMDYSEYDIQNRLKLCICILHKLKIVHKDIKPENILFSKEFNNFVLTDFGISHSIPERIGLKSQAYKEGTIRYMSPQMKQIPCKTLTLIDLYHNDQWSLKTSIREIIRSKKYADQIQFAMDNNQEKQIQIHEFYKTVKNLANYLQQKQNYEKTNINEEITEFLSKTSIFEEISKLQNIRSVKTLEQEDSNKKIYLQKDKRKIKEIKQQKVQKSSGSKKSSYFNEQLKYSLRNNKKITFKQIQKLELLGQLKRVEVLLQNQINKQQRSQLSYNYTTQINKMIYKLINIKIISKSNIQICKGLISKLKCYDLNQVYTFEIKIVQSILNYYEQKQVPQQICEKIIMQYPISYQKVFFLNFISIFQRSNQFQRKLKFELIFLDILLNEYPISHIEVMEIYYKIGNSYLYMGQYQNAQQYYQKIIQNIQQYQISEQTISICLNNIGVCYFKNGNYDQAIKYYQNDLKVLKQITGQNHPNVAATINNIGNCYLFKNQYLKALKAFEKSLVIKLNSLNEKHPDIAITYNSIGMCYSNLGMFECAQHNFQKALYIQQQLFGQFNLDLASTLNNIGCLKINGNEYEEGVSYCNRALKIKEQILGKNYIENVVNYINIGNAYKKMNKIKKMVKQYKKALFIIHENSKTIKKFNKNQLEFIISQLFNYFIKVKNFTEIIYILQKSIKLIKSMISIQNLAIINFSYQQLQFYTKRSYRRKIHQLQLQYNQCFDISTFYFSLSTYYFKLNKSVEAWVYLKKSMNQCQIIKKQQKKLQNLCKKSFKREIKVFKTFLVQENRKKSTLIDQSFKNLCIAKRMLFYIKKVHEDQQFGKLKKSISSQIQLLL